MTYRRNTKKGEYPCPSDANKFLEWRPDNIRTKILVMRLWMQKEEIDNTSPDLISKLFDKTQKASLWQIVKMKRAKTTNQEAAKAYEEIGTQAKGDRGGAVIAVNNKAMQIALFDDDEDAWGDHTLSILQVYKEKYKQGATAE